MDGTLTPDQNEAVQRDYKLYAFKAGGITDAQVAKEIGRSPSVLSQWKDGKYAGDVDEVTREVNNWMERDSRARNLALRASYVPTKVAEGMRAAVRLAHARGRMVGCVMPSGTGKTMMLDILAAELKGFVVYCDEGITGSRFLESVATAIKLNRERHRASYLLSAIVEQLRGSKRPLFVDEAHCLPKEVFGRIRSLHDQTGITIAMVGTDEIINRIDDRAGGRGQMARRTFVYNALHYYYNVEDPGGRTENRPLFSKEEIRSYLDALKVRVDPDAFELLWAIACMPDRGCLGTIADLAWTIIHVCKQSRITRQAIWEAMELTDVSERQHIVDHAKVFIERMAKSA